MNQPPPGSDNDRPQELVKSYTLSYDSSGGTEYRNERYEEGTIVKLDKKPCREGYNFLGWDVLAEDGSSVETHLVKEVKMTRNITVKAFFSNMTELISNPMGIIVNKDTKVSAKYSSEIDFSYYAQDNIPDYDIMTEIPKEHMGYINNAKYAVNCYGMFSDCYELETIDLSLFDTSKVTDMNYMFAYCYKINFYQELDIDTSNVLDMGHMFDNCTSMTHYHSYLNTDKVINMSFMFNNCSKLNNIILVNIMNTSNVTDMSFMFSGCKALLGFNCCLDLSSCKNVLGMFNNCPSLHSVQLKNVPRSLLNADGALNGAGGTLNETYQILNILEDR